MRGNIKTSTAKQKRASRKRLLKPLLLLLAVGLIVFLTVGYINTKHELDKTKHPEQTAKTEAKDLVRKLSSYLQLPSNETPTVATVKDRNQLADQSLKDAVKNGDKILVYAKAQVIAIYRPSTNKIVLFQPLHLTSRADQKTSKTSETSAGQSTSDANTPSPTGLTDQAGSDPSQ